MVGFVKQKWQKPVTLEELLVSTLPQGRPSKLPNREGCHHATGILAENRRGEGNLSKTAETDSAM